MAMIILGTVGIMMVLAVAVACAFELYFDYKD